jgi:peptidoglycan hydrolase-like protein with peptidoglycan-binding domain
LRLTLVPLSVALSAALAIGAWAASPQTSTTSTLKKKKSVAKTRSTTKTTPAASAAKTTPAKSKRPAVVAHRAPQQPSPERYKEIQQALATKGYFNNEPDGTWGPASIDALKRFQHDQNLVEDGKIGSLSLIALGLGPKRDAEPEQKTP